MKGECSTLKTQKEQADANTTQAKGLVTKLNKEVASQKKSIEVFKTALEKTKKEKEELTKAAKSNKLANKKISDAQVSNVGDGEHFQRLVSLYNNLLTNVFLLSGGNQEGRRRPRSVEIRSQCVECKG